MTNHVVIFTNHYLPKPGATALCVHQVAKFLASHGYKVDVVCFDNDERKENFDGVNTHYIQIPDCLKKNRYKSSFEKHVHRFQGLLYKLINFKNYPLRSKSLAQNYVQYAKKIIENPLKTIVVASFNPVEAVYAGMLLKKEIPELKTVYYSLDTLSNETSESSFIPLSYRQKKEVKLEKNLFCYFDRIVLMECHEKYYLSKEYDAFKHKFFIANFPLLEKCNCSSEIVEDFQTNHAAKKIVFVGSFYRKLRNPTFLCNVLSNLLEKIPLDISFLGGGDCQDILESFQKSHSSNVEVLGMQPHDVALQYIQSADILISVGNVNSPMAPSKIYEYMATGKPIIHVYSYEFDPCIEPLQKYGNALLVNQNVLINYSEIVNFINTASKINSDAVFTIFETSTPAYTAKIVDF